MLLQAKTKLQKMIFTESSSSMKLEGSLSDSVHIDSYSHRLSDPCLSVEGNIARDGFQWPRQQGERSDVDETPFLFASQLQWYENEDYNDIFTVHGIKDRYTFQHFPLVTPRDHQPVLV